MVTGMAGYTTAVFSLVRVLASARAAAIKGAT
jgi:hypothetical protein